MSFGNGEYYRQVIEGDRRELVEQIGMSQKKNGPLWSRTTDLSLINVVFHDAASFSFTIY